MVAIHWEIIAFYNDESGVEAGNLSGECAWSRIDQIAFWRYVDWYERVYSTSYRHYCRRYLLRIKKKAAASSSYMAWRNAGIIHLLGTVYEFVSVFGILPDDSSCVGSVSCLNQ